MNKLITTTPIDEPTREHGRPAWHCTICGEIHAACAATQAYYDVTVPAVSNAPIRYMLSDCGGSAAGRGRCDVCGLQCHNNRWHLWPSVWDEQRQRWCFTSSGELWAHVTCIEQQRDPAILLITYDEYAQEYRNRQVVIDHQIDA